MRRVNGCGVVFVAEFGSRPDLDRLSPCSEELARLVAAGVDPAPVKRWELPSLSTSPDRDDADLYEEEDDDEPVLLGPEVMSP